MLDDLLASRGCGALIVLAGSSRDPFLAPFAGPVRLAESILVAPRGAPPRLGFLTPMERDEAAASGLALLTPEALDVERWNRGGASPAELLANVLARALQLCELAPGRLALAGCVSAGRLQGACRLLAAEGWSFVPGEDLVQSLRKKKSARQLAAIRAAATGTTAAFRHVAGVLAAAETRDGRLWTRGSALTVGTIRRAAARVLHEHGLEQPEGNILGAGADGAVPHTIGADDRVVRPGESLIVDLFPRQARAWGTLFADCSRTFCVGEAPPALAAAHALVREALERARRAARPGVRGWSLQELVCEGFHEAGYPTQVSQPGTTRGYVHGLGHGVGYELHEPPFFKEEAGGGEGTLEVGDVFTIEPGLYDPEAGWAVRLEDLYHLGPNGLENLTTLPYDLDPRAW